MIVGGRFNRAAGSGCCIGRMSVPRFQAERLPVELCIQELAGIVSANRLSIEANADENRPSKALARRLRRQMRIRLHWCCALCLSGLLAALPALAAELPTRRLTLGGFGTVGGLYHDEEGLEYRRGGYQPRGAEADELAFHIDTLGGLQLNAAWNEDLEFVTQGIGRFVGDSNWDVELTRAFLRVQPDPALMLRVGRIGWELYPRLDSREIGYSYLPIRQPPELFAVGQTARDAVDGADLSFRHPLGPGLLALKVYGGRTGGPIFFADGKTSASLDGTKAWGGHAEYQQGPWALRLGLGRVLLPKFPELEAFRQALRESGDPELVRLGRVQRYFSYGVTGLTYDEGPLQARLVIVGTRFGSFDTRGYSGFGLVGYRFGDLTPFASYSAVNPELDHNKQRTYSLGLRYDFAPGLDLKFQVDRVHLRGQNVVIDETMRSGDGIDFTVFGVALDFAFSLP
jgi:hypothetical protein